MKKKIRQKLNSLIKDQKYSDAFKILNTQSNTEIDLVHNIYGYFLLECTSNKKNDNIKLSSLKNNIKEYQLFYIMGLVNYNLIGNLHSFYTFEDTIQYFKQSLQSNPHFSNSNFALGITLFKFTENCDEAIKYINAAIKINPIFLKFKDDYFSNCYFNNYSKDKLIITLKALQDLPQNKKNNSIYIKISEINNLLGNTKKAILILKNIRLVEASKSIKSQYYKLKFDHYISSSLYTKAMNISKFIDPEHAASSFYNIDEFEKSLILYKRVKREGRRIHQYVNINIARCFIKLEKFNAALKLIKENLNDKMIHIIYTQQYIETLLVKSQIFLIQKKYKESIDILNKAHISFIECSISTLKKELEGEILLLKIKVYIASHIRSIKDNTKKYKLEFNNEKELNNIISSYSHMTYFNSTSKTQSENLIKKLLSISNKYISEIEEQELLIRKNENIISKKVNKWIKDLLLNAFNRDIRSEDLKFRLARVEFMLKNYNQSIKIYKELLQDNPNDPTYLNNLAVALSSVNNKEQAISTIKKSIKLDQLHDSNITAMDNLLTFLTDSKYYDESKIVAHKLIEKSLIQDSNNFHLTNEGNNGINRLHLFKYKTFNTNTLNSIINNYFYFSNIDSLNDPLDIPLVEMSNKKDFSYLNINPTDIEVFCLSRNSNNTLMWSHYADSHKGICIGYKIKSLPKHIGWDTVNYVPENYDYKRASLNKGLISAGFYSKHENWAYEKEIRLVKFKNDQNKIKYKNTLNIGDREKYISAYISEITLGYKFDKTNISLIKSIINDYMIQNPNSSIIKLYQTELDKNYPFKLDKKEIDI